MSFGRQDAEVESDSASTPGGDAAAIPDGDTPEASPPTESGHEGEVGSSVESAAGDGVEESAPAPVVTEPQQTEPPPTEPTEPLTEATEPPPTEPPEIVPRPTEAPPTEPLPEIVPWPATDPWPVTVEPPQTEPPAETLAPPEIVPWPDTDPWPVTMEAAETIEPRATEVPPTEPPPEIVPWPDTDPWPVTAEAPAPVEASETEPPPEIVPGPATDPWPVTVEPPQTEPPPEIVAPAEIVPWPATDPWPVTVAPEPPPPPEIVAPPEIVPWPATDPWPVTVEPPQTEEPPETVAPPEIVPWPATDPWPVTVEPPEIVAPPEIVPWPATDPWPVTLKPPPPEPPPAPPPLRALPLRPGPCLARLDDGIAAATALGLAIDEAEATRTEADERLGLSSEVCVVALIGGTGVGKSTLLNALAGTEVSAASARRPTTGQPVAWIPGAARGEMAPLLDWLGVDAVVEHADPHFASVAILDLPDLDSVDRSHRERVEELLPRVDAVVWVSDPEKYRDAVLHEDFLVRWLPRLDRQIVVLNKSDRLGAKDLEPVRAHFERSLRSDMVEGPGSPSVVAVAAKRGEIEPVRDWVNAQVDAKRVVLGRISASVVDGLEALARQAGVNPDLQALPLLDPANRKRSIDAATDQVLRLVDLPTTTRQAVAATRAAARPRGLGPLGKLTAWLYRTSGRQARVADPELFLRAWSERGSLAPALDALRSAVDEPLRTAPAAIRPAIAASVDGNRLAMRLRAAVDAAMRTRGSLVAPTSRLWPVLGVLQTLATGAVAVAAAWLVLVVVLRPPVDVVTLPIVGQVPAPFAMLVGALIVAFVVARVLAVHAGWLGRRWAKSVATDVRAAVERAVADEAFAPLDRVDTARRSLWLAARGARDACARR